jgi:hypothetical protein
MKALFVHLVLMAITFGLGLGFHWFIPKHNARSIQIVDAPKIVEALATNTSTANLIFDYDPSRFIPDGTYFIQGPTPQEFREFKAFDLRRIEIEGQPIRYVGIQTYSNHVYSGQPVVFALVTERRILFVTSANQNGFRYMFMGEFIRDPDYNADTNVSVLHGELTKFEFGRKIAARELTFRLERTGH